MSLDVKPIFLSLLILLSYNCSAQDDSNDCDPIMINNAYETVHSEISSSGEFLSVSHAMGALSKKNASQILYRRKGDGFELAYKILLDNIVMPKEVFLFNNGNVLLFGDKEPSLDNDSFYLYGLKGNLIKKIDVKSILNDKVKREIIDKNKKKGICDVEKYWICREDIDGFYYEDNLFMITDVLGNNIGINVNSGELSLFKERFGACN